MIILISRRDLRYPFVALLALVLGFIPLAARADDLALYVMAGQSNMQGYQGDAAQYPADPEKLDADILFYWDTPTMSNSGQQWTVMKPQGGRFPAGHFGPEVTFARTLAREYKQGYVARRPAVFKCSLGGTSIASFWKTPGKGGQYDKMMVELKTAVDLLKKQGHTVEFSGFIWIQGESDAQTPALAKAYGPALAGIVKNFRESTDPQVPVILGLDEQHDWVKANPQVIQAQLEIAKKWPHILVTSMIGLAKADGTHLTPAGLVEQGQRLHTNLRVLAPVGKLQLNAKATAKH